MCRGNNGGCWCAAPLWIGLGEREGGGLGGGFDFVGGDFAPQAVREVDAFRDEHGVEGDFRRGDEVTAALEGGDPVMLGAVVGVTDFTDVVDAPVVTAEIGAGVEVEITGAAEITEGIEADAALRADDNRAFDFVEVDGPRFDDVEGEAALQTDEAEAEFFDIIAAELGAFFVHGDFLMG